MPAMMDSMKGADYVHAPKRSMAVGTFLAVGVGAFIAVMIQLHIIYTHGGIHLNSWLFSVNPKLYFGESTNILAGRAPFDYRAPVWFSVGTAFTLFLYVMRARFWWWQFHPLGYAIGCAWPAVVYWCSFFIGWLLKSLILRYGGANYLSRLPPILSWAHPRRVSTAIIWALLSGLFGLASPAIPSVRAA